MSENEEFATPEPRGISRRTVAKAAVWTIPVIALATPSPAFAASGGAPTVVPGVACKIPGNSCGALQNKSYLLPFTFTNNDAVKTIYITGVSISTNPDVGIGFALSVPPLPASIAPSGVQVLQFNTSANNSANQVFEATVTITWGHVADGSDHDDAAIVSVIQIDGTNPCVNCSAV